MKLLGDLGSVGLGGGNDLLGGGNGLLGGGHCPPQEAQITPLRLLVYFFRVCVRFDTNQDVIVAYETT